MSGDPADNNFDWVTTRYSCTANAAFKHLRDLAQTNVCTRCAQTQSEERPSQPPPRFQPGTDREREFVAYAGGAPTKVRIPTSQFPPREYPDDLRDLEPAGLEQFSITVGMNEEGRCQLRIDDEPLRDWQ